MKSDTTLKRTKTTQTLKHQERDFNTVLNKKTTTRTQKALAKLMINKHF